MLWLACHICGCDGHYCTASCSHPHVVVAEPQTDDEAGGESAAAVVVPTGTAPLPIADPPFSSVPLVLGMKALGPFRWTNTAHGGRHDVEWSGGSGIGVSELFVGLDDNVCMFGIHAESRGCDFINILTQESDPGVCACVHVCL